MDKYNNLAREALSIGDKIMSENYFQHADHFTRILKEKEIQKKANYNNKSSDIKDDLPENKENKIKSISDKEKNSDENHSEVN